MQTPQQWQGCDTYILDKFKAILTKIEQTKPDLLVLNVRLDFKRGISRTKLSSVVFAFMLSELKKIFGETSHILVNALIGSDCVSTAAAMSFMIDAATETQNQQLQQYQEEMDQYTIVW